MYGETGNAVVVPSVGVAGLLRLVSVYQGFLHLIEAGCPFVERSNRRICSDWTDAFASKPAPTGDL